MVFELHTPGAACGDEHGAALGVNDVMLSAAAPAPVLQHSLGAVIFESGRYYGIYYYDGQHGGRRGRALSALRAGVGGAGGIDSAFFVSVLCVAAASAAACLGPEAHGNVHALMRAGASRRVGGGRPPPRAASCCL